MTQNPAGNILSPTTGDRVLPPPPGIIPPLGSPGGAVPQAGQTMLNPLQPLPGQPQGMPMFSQPGQPMQQQQQQVQQVQAPAQHQPLQGLVPMPGMPQPSMGLPAMAPPPGMPQQQQQYQQVPMPVPQQQTPQPQQPQAQPVQAQSQAQPPVEAAAPATKTRTRNSRKKKDAAQTEPVQTPDPNIAFNTAHVSTVGAPGTVGQPNGIQGITGSQVSNVPPGQFAQGLPVPVQPVAQPVPVQQAQPPAQYQQPQPVQVVVAQASPASATIVPDIGRVVDLDFEDIEVATPDGDAGETFGDAVEDCDELLPPVTHQQLAAPFVGTPSSPMAAGAINYSKDFIAGFSLKDEPEDEVAQARALEAAIQSNVERAMMDYGITAAFDSRTYNQNDLVQNAVHILRFEAYLLENTEISKLNEYKCALSAHVISVRAMEGRMRAQSDYYGKMYGDLMEGRQNAYASVDKVKDRKAAVLRNEPEMRRYRHQYFLAVALHHLFTDMSSAFENLTHSLNRIIDDKMYEKQRELGGRRTQ